MTHNKNVEDPFILRVEAITGRRASPIDGWPGYVATDDGRVFSIKSNRLDRDAGTELHELHHRIDKHDGRRRVKMVGADGKDLCVPIGRCMLLTFKPHPHAEKLVVGYLNSDLTDNRLENVEWRTRKENANTIEHKQRIGDSTRLRHALKNMPQKPCDWEPPSELMERMKSMVRSDVTVQPLRDWPEYFITSDATIYSVKLTANIPIENRIPVIKEQSRGHIVATVLLTRPDGTRKRCLVTSLMLFQFGAEPGQDNIEYLDNNPLNLAIDNLRWTSKINYSYERAKNARD